MTDRGSTMETTAGSQGSGSDGFVRGILSWLTWVSMLLAPPLLRIAVAIPFFRSGLTKWEGLSLSTSALWLFENEFKLHIFGTAYDFPMPYFSALASSVAEIVLPILLVIGLATRFAAAGIVLMTILIQLVVPDGWLTFHLPWAAMGLAIVAIGPGALSLDRLIDRSFAR